MEKQRGRMARPEEPTENDIENVNENPDEHIRSPKLEEEGVGPISGQKGTPFTVSPYYSSSEMRGIEEYEQNPNPTPTSEQPPLEVQKASPPTYHTFSIHIISLLMSFSVFGTLARLGIHALVSYPGQSIFPLAWVQAVGCAIMGFALATREPITQFYGPLYTAITTGFCGSLTTFSGWQLDVFSAWGNGSGIPKLWIYDVMDGLTRLLFTFTISLASFGVGVHLGKRSIRFLPRLTPLNAAVRWTITSVSIALYVLTIPFFVRLNHSWRPLATAALIFSFPGTFTRYVLSTQLNPRFKRLPIGTLIANEMATAILATSHIIQRAPALPLPVACSILQGFIDGYCGCLSTVSTFVSEIRMLKGKKSWLYAAVSVGLGQVICLVILGPLWWSGTIHEDHVCKGA